MVELEPVLTGLVRKEVLSLQADPLSPERGQYGFLQELVRRAVERIAAAVSAAPDSLLLTQIKEKFGTLRLSTWPGLGFTDAMDAAVEEAMSRTSVCNVVENFIVRG